MGSAARTSKFRVIPAGQLAAVAPVDKDRDTVKEPLQAELEGVERIAGALVEIGRGDTDAGG